MSAFFGVTISIMSFLFQNNIKLLGICVDVSFLTKYLTAEASFLAKTTFDHVYRKMTGLCDFFFGNLLYKVDLSTVGVGHLPVFRQRSQLVLLGRMAQVKVCLLCALRGGRWRRARPRVGQVTLARDVGAH